MDKLDVALAILLEETKKALAKANSEQECRDIKARAIWCMEVTVAICLGIQDKALARP